MIAPNDRNGQHRGDERLDREAIPLDLAQTPLWEELNQHLEQHGREDLDHLRDDLKRLPWSSTSAGDALQRALERADPPELLTLAHRLGREWLAAG